MYIGLVVGLSIKNLKLVLINMVQNMEKPFLPFFENISFANMWSYSNNFARNTKNNQKFTTAKL